MSQCVTIKAAVAAAVAAWLIHYTQSLVAKKQKRMEAERKLKMAMEEGRKMKM